MKFAFPCQLERVDEIQEYPASRPSIKNLTFEGMVDPHVVKLTDRDTLGGKCDCKELKHVAKNQNFVLMQSESFSVVWLIKYRYQTQTT